MARSRWASWGVGLVTVLGVACVPVDLGDLPTFGDSGTPDPDDQDGDGVPDASDCDDSDPITYPHADEVCDGHDNDCDLDTDEGVGTTFFADEDDDGYGDPAVTVEACDVPDGYADNDDDCNDADAAIHPGAPELCNAGVDDDCNSFTDEEAQAYEDGDGDGFAVTGASSIRYCDATGTVALLTGDCDDANAALHPALVDDDGAQTPPGLTAFIGVQSGVDMPDNCGRVLILPGLYTGPVTLEATDALSLLGLSGAAATGLTNGDGSPVVSITGSSNIYIGGLSVSAAGSQADFGAGIRIEASAHVVLQGLGVTDNLLEGNNSFGAGVGVRDSEDVQILDSYFARNQADEGGAVGIDASSAFIGGSYFEDNVGDYGGGAIGLGGLHSAPGLGTLTVQDSYFLRNLVPSAGGAIGAYPGSLLESFRNYFEANQATAAAGYGIGGGAVYNPALVEECYFLDNASGSYGGALLVADSALIRSSIFWYNEAGLSGGAMNLFGTLSSASYHTVTQNTFVGNSSPQGGTIYYYDGDDLQLYNNILYDELGDNSMLCSVEVGKLSVFNNDLHSPGDRDDLLCFSTEDDFDGDNGNTHDDPQFKTLTESGIYWEQDLHLKEGSPARGTGEPGEDGTPYDMGAYSGPVPLDWVPQL